MTVSSLVVKIGADISELQSAMGRVQKSIDEAGKRMTSLGKTISARVTAPLTALGGVAVRAFGIQEKAEMQLRAALQANGREVDKLFDRYNRFASQMQEVTVVGDETTLAMLQQAESMGITGDAAERAVKNAIALSATQDVSAKSAIRYTAALEQGNATMLARYLPTLRDVEEGTERTAMAQDILGKAFSVAEAEAQTTVGAFSQMKNAVGDLLEEIGSVIAEAILPFVRRIKEMAEAAQTANRSTIKMAVTIAGIAAAIGPVLIVLGQLTRALSLVLTPIFAKIAAIMGLVLAFEYVRRNLDVFINRIMRGFAKVRNIVIQEVDTILEAIQGWAKWLPGNMDLAIVQARASLLSLTGDVPEIEGEFQSAGEFITDVVSDIGAGFQWLSNMVFPGTATAAAKTMETISASSTEASKAFQRAVWLMNFTSMEFAETAKTVQQTGIELGQALQTSITSAATSFAESIGQMISAGSQGGTFFQRLLVLIGDFASQFGRIAIAMGVAALEIQTNLLTNPLAVIAAGGALVALGSALSSLVSSGIGGSGGGGAVSQDFQPSARSERANSGGNVRFEIQYDKLVGVLDNGDRRRSRI